MTEGFSSGLGRYTFGPGRLLVDVAEQIASSLLDRPIDLRFGEARSQFVLRSLHLQPTPFGVAAGRLDRVGIGLDDVRWADGALDRLDLGVHELRFAPGLRPALVAGPVDVSARLRQDTLDEWLGLAGVAFGVRLGDDGAVRVTMPGRFADRWAHAAMVPEIHGHELRLRADDVKIGGRSVPGAARLLPPLMVPIPHLPRGLVLRGVRVEADLLVIEGVIPTLREPVSVGQLQDIRRAVLRFAGRELVLPRLAR